VGAECEALALIRFEGQPSVDARMTPNSAGRWRCPTEARAAPDADQRGGFASADVHLAVLVLMDDVDAPLRGDVLPVGRVDVFALAG
jgi:hypothetical protein